MVETAWQQGVTGNGQVVAILDSGVDRNHSFLANKVVDEACFSTNSYPSYSVCPNGSNVQYGTGAAAPCPSGVTGCDHGTHVAGIAAGRGTSFSGVARDAKIIAVQVFSAIYNASTGSFSASAYASDIVNGLLHVYDRRSQFSIAAVNLSLGVGSYSGYCDSSNPYYKSAIDLLRSVGIATIVASGNDGYKSAVRSPACISSAISVGATDKSDRVWTYSNSTSILKLLAPGVSIYSSVPGSYDYMTGTSMATPHVTGAFAALRSQLPGASIDTITNALWNTGVPIMDSNYLVRPRIQLDAAMNALAPANDKFANATWLQGTSLSTGGSNQGATKESGEPYHDNSIGGRSVWWRWTAPSSGTVTIDTFGSNFDTLLGVYRGTQLSTLTTVASNDDTGGMQSRVSFQATSGTTYSIAVDGYNGAMGSVVLHLAATTAYTLTVSKSGNGTVSSSPAGINCGTDCSEDYASGTVVTLTATPATGSTFAGWSGACSGTGTCQVTMSQARSVSATFTLPTTGSLGDTVYYDLNGNRAQDTGEPGVQDVTVQLKNSAGMVVATDITDNSGNYLFENLAAGVYTLVVVTTNSPIAGFTNTADPDNPGANGNSQAVVNLAGENNLSQDFGYRGFDWGDAPDNLSGLPDYPTLSASNGPRHAIGSGAPPGQHH